MTTAQEQEVRQTLGFGEFRYVQVGIRPTVIYVTWKGRWEILEDGDGLVCVPLE